MLGGLDGEDPLANHRDGNPCEKDRDSRAELSSGREPPHSRPRRMGSPDDRQRRCMTQAVPIPTSQSYAPPTVRQFSVFLENKVGRLLDLVQLFDEAPNVHICAFSVLESSDYAVVRLIPNNADAARALLKRHNLSFSELDLLIVELCESHTLSSMCLHLLGAELNIRFAYPLMLKPNGTPTIALSVDDQVLAGQILRKKSFRLLGEGDLP